MIKLFHITLLVMVSTFSLYAQSTKVVFTVFVSHDIDAHYTKHAKTFETHMFPKSVNAKLLNKVIKSRKATLKDNNPKKSIGVKKFYLNPDEWIIVYKAIYKTSDGNEYPKIQYFKSISVGSIDSLVNRDVFVGHSATSDYYVGRNTVLLKSQPYLSAKKDESNKSMLKDLMDKMIQYLTESEKEQIKKEYKRASSLGGRG